MITIMKSQFFFFAWSKVMQKAAVALVVLVLFVSAKVPVRHLMARLLCEPLPINFVLSR